MPSSQPQTFARGCALQAILSIVAIFVAVPVVLVLAFLANTVPYDSVWAYVLMFGAPLVLGGGLLSLGLGFGLWNRRRIARWLDEAMAPLGLDGAAYMMLGRQYHGEVDGRPVHATFNRGPVFQLTVECNARTRFVVARGNMLNRRVSGVMDYEPVTHPLLASHDIICNAKDPGWTGRLLDQPGVAEVVERLVRKEGYAWIRNLVVTPHAIKLHLHRVGMGAVTAEHVEGWHADLRTLAEAIDGMEDPLEILEPSALELTVLHDPGKIARLGYLIGLGIVAALLLMSVCMGAVGFLLATASH